MCGRFVQHLSPYDYARRFGVKLGDEALPNAPARFNAAPTQDLMVIRRNPESGELVLSLLRWGLVPVWSKDASGGARLINARSETVTEKASFRAAWHKRRRCLVPADGFYEWRRLETGKQANFITLKTGQPFVFAGLWEGWKDPASGLWLRTFTILTCAANPLLQPLHERMPVILRDEDMAAFLDAPDPQELLKPLPQEEMTLWPVAARVNDVRNDGPDLIVPLAATPAED